MKLLTNKFVPQGTIINDFVSHELNALKIDEKERSIVHKITTGDKNRYNQVIDPAGMFDANFAKNPVVLWQHGSILANTADDIPIAKSLWRQLEGNAVIAKTQFHTLPFATDLWELCKNGFLNAWSIGFMPLSEIERDADGTRKINKWELFEYSLVTIPANAAALNNMFDCIQTDALKNELTETFAVELFRNELDEIKNKLAGMVSISNAAFVEGDYVKAAEYNKLKNEAVEKVTEIVIQLNKNTADIDKLKFKLINS